MENAGRATRRRKRLRLQESKKLMKEAYEASTLRRGRATHVKVPYWWSEEIENKKSARKLEGSSQDPTEIWKQ